MEKWNERNCKARGGLKSEKNCLVIEVSITSTFYAQLFCTKVLCKAFLKLQFDLAFFGLRIPEQKLLVKCQWNWLKVSIQSVRLQPLSSSLQQHRSRPVLTHCRRPFCPLWRSYARQCCWWKWFDRLWCLKSGSRPNFQK